MNDWRRQVTPWLVGVTALLLPLLAVLQYRWVDDVSELERQRMNRSVRAATDRFADDLDDVLTEIYWTFHLREPRADRIGSQLAEEYAGWKSSFPYPGLVERVYVIDLEGGGESGARIRELSLDDGELAPCAWPGWLEKARSTVAREASRDGWRRRGRRTALPPLLDRVPAVGIFQDDLDDPAWFAVQLDREVLFEQVIPDRLRDYFETDGGLDYHVWIVEDEDPDRLVYASHPDAPVDLSDADDTEETFGLDRGLRRDLGDAADHRWRVVVKHVSGSLETAVARVRRRNLLLGFGIVGLLGATMGALVVSTRRARSLARQQMEFVAGVTHELRTPLAGISSLSENLADGVIGDLEQVRRYGDAIHGESHRLSNMVEQVLTFASLHSGERKLSREAVDVAALVAATLEKLEDGGVDTGSIDVGIDDDLPRVVGDRAALGSALRNLLNNAVKFSDPDAPVRVTASGVRSGGEERVRIRVEDRGPGIPDSERKRIFDPFFRGRAARDDQVEGSGLGLSLVKRIVEAHGGDIRLSSEPGEGTTFTLDLPVASTVGGEGNAGGKGYGEGKAGGEGNGKGKAGGRGDGENKAGSQGDGEGQGDGETAS